MRRSLRGSKKPVDITDLRVKMSEVYQHSGEFDIGASADSMEALINLLGAVHYASVGDSSLGVNSTLSIDSCNSCPSHRAFDFRVTERITCQCNSTDQFDWDLCSFTHPFYVAEVIEEGKQYDSAQLIGKAANELIEYIEHCSALQNEGKLPELIRHQWASAVLYVCPNDNCTIKQSSKTMYLRSSPEFFMVNCVWQSRNPGPLEILQVVATIPLSLSLDKIYEGGNESNYSLNGIILYGAAHYIYFTRGHKDSWLKVDDERSVKLTNDQWKDVITQMIRSRFYPTGLIYRKSRKVEVFQISLEDWLLLEQTAARMEKELWGLAREEEPEKKYSSRLRESLVPNSKPLKVIEENTWQCKCKANNSNDHQTCSNGVCLKPGVQGWICKTCTFLNSDRFFTCDSCGQTKGSSSKILYWKCEFCSEHNESRYLCTYCGIDKNEQVGWTCTYCRALNPTSKYLCWKCKQPYSLCKNCNLRERTEQSYYCEECYRDRISSREWKCANCGLTNYSTQTTCYSCKTNKNSISQTASGLRNSYNKQQERPSFDNRVSGFPAERSPIKSRNDPSPNWNCPTCGTLNTISPYKCYYCFSYKDSSSKNSPAAPASMGMSRDVCVLCKSRIGEMDPHLCSYCRGNTTDWKCKDCYRSIPEYRRVCSLCITKLWCCEICKTRNLPSMSCCDNCYYSKKEAESLYNKPKTRKISSTASNCSVCRNYLDGMERRNCALCGKRSRDDYCSRCDIEITRHICDRCARTHWVCINCGTSNSKNKGNCKCGFRNRFVLEQGFRR